MPESRILSVLGPIQEESTQKKLIDETIKKFSRLDVLVNNAGISHKTGTDPNSFETFDYVMDINVRSLIALTRLAVPHLEKTKGNVVNISSIGGQRAVVEAVPYVLTKAAVDHFTRNAAVEYADKGIRVNTVSPGATETEFSARHGFPEEMRQKRSKMYIDNIIPMHRYGKAGNSDSKVEKSLRISSKHRRIFDF